MKRIGDMTAKEITSTYLVRFYIMLDEALGDPKLTPDKLKEKVNEIIRSIFTTGHTVAWMEIAEHNPVFTIKEAKKDEI